jgi:hypothetical protein
MRRNGKRGSLRPGDLLSHLYSAVRMGWATIPDPCVAVEKARLVNVGEIFVSKRTAPS